MTRTAWPGLVLLDERFLSDAFDSTNSVLTQADPLPGTPEDLGDSAMVLETAGAQTADWAALVTRGGMAGPDEAGLVFAPDADASTEWQGWNPPTSISQWDALVYASVLHAHKQFDIARTADSLVLLDYAGTRYVNAWRRSTAGISSAWAGPVTIHDNGAVYITTSAHPTITADADGNPLAFYLVENAAGTQAQVRVARSTDAGATWTIIQRAALRSPIDLATYTITRMRAAYRDGEVLLVLAAVDTTLTYDDVIIQYASVDEGLNFGLVDTWTGADEDHHGAYPSLAVADGQFVMAYLRRTSSGEATTARPYIRRIGTATTPLSGAEALLAQSTANTMRWATLTANVFDSGSGDCALSADEHGVLWIIGRDVADDHQCVTYMSLDAGDTWLDDELGGSSAGASGPVWWDGQDANTHPKAMAAAWWGGQLVVAHSFAAGPGVGDDSLCVLYLGGYTRAEMPLEGDTSRHYTRASWERTYLPFDLPENTGATWAQVLVGAPTITLDTTSGALKIVAIAGEGVYWYATPTAGTLAEGVAAFADFEVAAGPSQYLQVRAGVAGPSSYKVIVAVTTTDVVVTDQESAANLATEAVSTDRVQVLIWVGNSAAAPANDGQVRVWIRETSVITGTTHWRQIVQTATLQKGTDTTHEVRFGAGVGVSETYTRLVQFTSGAHVGTGWYTNINPTNLQGRSVSANWMDLDSDGLQVRCVDGPGRKGDAWLLPVRYTHRIENVHWDDAPGTDREWRSTGVGSVCTLDWTFGVARRGYGTSRSLGVYIDTNIRAAEVYLKNAAGAWVKYADIDTAAGQGTLAWSLSGAIAQPDANAAAKSYAYGDHELAGCAFEMDTGATPVCRLIETNGAGAWSGTAGVQPIMLQLSGCDGTEPTTGTAGYIRARRTLVIINNIPAYRGFRLVIAAQPTAEGYFCIRALHVGPVVLFAHPYTSSRDEGFESGTVLTEAPNLAARSRVLADPKRYVEFGWEEGTLTTLANGAAPAPRATPLYTAGPGVASEDLAAYQLTGIYERVRGSDRPVVYASSIPVQAAAADDITVNLPRRLILGRIQTEEIKRTTVRGDEDSATQPEVVRVARARIREA